MTYYSKYRYLITASDVQKSEKSYTLKLKLEAGEAGGSSRSRASSTSRGLLLEEIRYDNLQYRRAEDTSIKYSEYTVSNKTSVAVQCNGYAWLMTSKARLHVYPATSAAAADADDDVVVAS